MSSRTTVSSSTSRRYATVTFTLPAAWSDARRTRIARSWLVRATGWASAARDVTTETQRAQRNAQSHCQGRRCMVSPLLAVAQGHEGIAGDQVGNGLHPATLVD